MTSKSPPITIKKFNLSKAFIVLYGFEKIHFVQHICVWSVNVE